MNGNSISKLKTKKISHSALKSDMPKYGSSPSPNRNYPILAEITLCKLPFPNGWFFNKLILIKIGEKFGKSGRFLWKNFHFSISVPPASISTTPQPNGMVFHSLGKKTCLAGMGWPKKHRKIFTSCSKCLKNKMRAKSPNTTNFIQKTTLTNHYWISLDNSIFVGLYWKANCPKIMGDRPFWSGVRFWGNARLISYVGRKFNYNLVFQGYKRCSILIGHQKIQRTPN